MAIQVVVVWIGVALRRGRNSVAHFAPVAMARIQSGQSMVEYAVIVAVIAIACLAAVQAAGNGIAGVFQRILSSISGIG
ncbi:MAG TPA: Flp family type IVb pilin [Candidatus Saccharimonadales bacterium]|nr:Flp family type IVb pilin [Candidatus Saccharimonadales bacterium]HVC34652.1 Flp family type IVb pilin [Chloroflexota bacterium]